MRNYILKNMYYNMCMTINNIAGSEHLNEGEDNTPDYIKVGQELDKIRITQISKVASFNELYETLKEIKYIETSKGAVVPAETFINIINDIRNGKLPLKRLTYDAGLQEKVLELLGQEKVH